MKQAADESSEAEVSGERRITAARWLLVSCGLAALLTFFLVPFGHAGPFASVIALPAFNVSDPELPALDNLAEAVKLDELGAVRADGTVTGNAAALTPSEIYAVGAAMVDVAPAVVIYPDEVALTGRYLQAAMLTLLVLAAACLLFPLAFGAESGLTLAMVGGCALLLLAAHAVMVALDLSGIAPSTVFTWQSHVASLVLVGAVGLGTVMPLNRNNVLAAVFGSLGVFMGLGIFAGILIAAL